MISKTLAIYGMGALPFMIGFAYVIYQQTDINGWTLLLERLGLPLIFLGGLLWMLWSATKAIAPFLKERIEQMTMFPENQFKLEREERIEKQARFEEIVAKISSDHNLTIKELSHQNANTQAALSGAISELAKQIELLARKVGEK